MEDSERRKVVELIKEMRSENDAKDNQSEAGTSRLNWMYKGPSDLVDREEYLLGKTIDKTFEALNNAGNSDVLGRTGEVSNVPKRLLEKTDNTEQVDIAKKILEDPLYAIKQKELEARKKLLNNPVKLKQIKQMLLERSKKAKAHKKQKKNKIKKKNLSSEEVNRLILKYLRKLSDKEKRKALNQITQSDSDYDSSDSSSSESESEKKKNKHKQKRKRSNSSSSDNSSSSSGRNTKNHKSKKQKKDKNKKRSKEESSTSSSETSSSSKDVEKKAKKKKKIRNKNSKKSESSSSSSSSSLSDTKSDSSDSSSSDDEDSGKRKKQSKSLEYLKYGNDKKNSYHRRDRSQDRNKHKNCDRPHRDDSSERGRKKRNYGLMMPDGSKPVSKRHSSPVKSYEKPTDTKAKYVPPPKAKPLSEKEREAKLKEMMTDAKLRKVDREKNLASHRKKEEKEEDSRTYDDDFMRRQMSHLTSQGSVADRIKSNINNIQRSKSSMDSSFMRK